MKTCAIIVTYNPNIKQFLKYIFYNKQEVDYSIIIDNSEKTFLQSEIYKLNKDINTEVIQLKNNYGIAYAQNYGVRRAEEIGHFKYVLFLDQDSMLQSGTVNIYKSYYKSLSNNHNIASLGIGNNQKKENEYIQVNQIISSGTFTPIKLFKKIGYFDETLFIDFVEYDWCWRAIKKGYKIFSIKSISLIHMHGDGKIKIFIFSMVSPSPVRLYYQYRNILILLHKSYVPLKWKINMFSKMFIKMPLYFFLLKNKKQTLFYIFRGIKDYFINKKGKYND